jgi:hypothetical protein
LCFQPKGTRIPGVTLFAWDRDVILGDWIDFIVEDSEEAYMIGLDNNTGSVFVNEVMRLEDHLPNKTFDFFIHVYDSQALKAENDIRLTLTVHDINNHAPFFDEQSYNGTVQGDLRSSTLYLG